MRTPTLGAGVVLAVLVVAVGCSSTGLAPGGEDWSRSYAHSLDRVWRAVTDALSDGGYFLEDIDRERGLIRAESRSDRSYERMILEVQVFQRGELVRVLIQGRGGGVDSPVGFQRINQAVTELLLDLDDRLRRPAPAP